MSVRRAVAGDVEAITDIYNQGIEDRIATLEVNQKSAKEIGEWFSRDPRYVILATERDGEVIGWTSLNPYSHRCAYAGVADLSVYVRRDQRGQGVGTKLLEEIEEQAAENGFHKIVLFTFPFSELGQGLYRKRGYREVGVFREQGKLDGQYVDVMAMEKILKES